MSNSSADPSGQGLKARTELRPATVFAVEGFESDLLPEELLRKHAKSLTRPAMWAAAQDGRIPVKVNALASIALGGPASAAELPLLSVLLKDTSASVRLAALKAMHNCQDVEPATVALLGACLDRDPQVARAIPAAVLSLGAGALPVLIRHLRIDSELADRTTIPLLIQFGEAARQPLLLALSHPDAQMRANSLAALISLGNEGLEAMSARIRALVSDPDAAVRALARQALAILARFGKPMLIEARALPLDGFAETLVDDAALKKAGKALETTALHALTRDGRGVVRANAWHGLATLGPLPADLALEAAVACKDAEADVRREAALALRKCPAIVLGHVLPPLVIASRDADKTVAQAARQAIFSQGKQAVSHLIELFGERDGRVHEPAVALATALDHDAVPALVEALDAPLPLVRLGALQALTGIGGKALDHAAAKVLAQLTNSHDPVRAAALRAIEQLEPATCKKFPALRSQLLQIWRADASLVVRQAAEKTLARVQAVS